MSESLDLQLYLRNNGSIALSDLVDIVDKHGLDEFLSEIKNPFLVSADIQKGVLEEFAAFRNSTLNFDPEDEQPEEDEEFFNKLPIYPLIKPEHTESAIGVFRIGRHADNDLVIADYTISRMHGMIKKQKGSYIYIAKKSKNGSFINGEEVEEDAEVEMPIGGTIGIGRYVFNILSPEELYIKLS